jgi:hypothetical protein
MGQGSLRVLRGAAAWLAGSCALSLGSVPRANSRRSMLDHVGHVFVEERVLGGRSSRPEIGYNRYLEFLANLRRLVRRPHHPRSMVRSAAESHCDPATSCDRHRAAGGSGPFSSIDPSQLVPVESPEADKPQAAAEPATGSCVGAVLADETVAQRDTRWPSGCRHASILRAGHDASRVVIVSGSCRVGFVASIGWPGHAPTGQAATAGLRAKRERVRVDARYVHDVRPC